VITVTIDTTTALDTYGADAPRYLEEQRLSVEAILRALPDSGSDS
jgi:hypothetical protein